jgi:hypothetical protein
MDAFHWIIISISTFQALCIARFLSGMVAVFRSRKHSQLDWVPILWAFAAFILQIQFWWAIKELSNAVPVWTLFDFLLMLGIPLALYLTVSLILPSDELSPGTSLIDLFRDNGHWGLVCLAIYAVIAIIIDWRLFGIPLKSEYFWVLPIEFLLPLLFLVAPRSYQKKTVTLLYFVLILWSSWEFSPKQYT